MRKLGEVLADLAKKGGLQHTDNIKDLIALTTPVSEETEQSLMSLMNASEAENWAKGNVSIKNHYTAQAYNGWDDKLFKSADKLQFTDEEKEQLRGERNTGKRQDIYNDILERRITEANKAATNAGKNNNAEAEAKWKAEHDKLSGVLSKTKDEYEDKLKQKDSAFYEYKMTGKMDNVLGSQKWSEHIPTDMRGDIGRLAIQKKLDSVGAKAVLDENGEVKLVRKDNIDMPYFDSSNKNPKFTEFAAKVLDENKFLAVSAQTQTSNKTNNNTFTPPVPNPGGTAANTNKRPNTVQALLQKSIQDQAGM